MSAPSLTAGPALWATSLTLARLHAALQQHAAAGTVRNLKTGDYTTATPEYLASIMSSVNLAVRQAQHMELLDNPSVNAAHGIISVADLRPILGVLPELAELGAVREQHARPDSAGDFVRKALVTIEFLTKSGGGRDIAACFLPSWQPLYAASQVSGRSASKKGRGSVLLLMQRVALKHGRTSPKALPSERAELVQWGRDAGAAAGTMNVTLSAYQHALKKLGTQEQAGYPMYPRVRMTSERHLGMLPDVVQRAQHAGCTESAVKIRDLPALDLLKLLAPGVAEDVEDYLALPRRRELGRDAYLSVITTVSRYVAGAIRLSAVHAAPFASGTARLLYFLEHMVTVDAVAPGMRAASRGLQARGGGSATIVQVPLLHAVLDTEAIAARKNSCILTANGAEFYPTSVKGCLGNLWRIIQHLYGGMSESEPATWEMLSLRYLRVQDRVNHRAAGAPRGSRSSKPVPLNAKNKRLAIRTVTLPQLVCIGLPVLANHVDALRVRYERVLDRARRSGHDDSHLLVRNARGEWHDWLTRYVVLALATDDGLRLSNYTYARIGGAVEIQPTFARAADGTHVLRALKTRFTGTGGTQPEARLKMLERPGAEGERERAHQVSPGVVRMDLVQAYLEGPRLENLLFHMLTDRAGVAVTAATYSLQDELAGAYGEPFAFFASYRAVRADRAYNKNRASEQFGEALHWVVRHALGRTVPDLESIDKNSEYRGIFSIHISRLYIATYWLGVRTDLGREGIDRAMHFTDDTEDALRDDYNVVDDVIREARRVYVQDTADRWQHPDAYNSYMDRLYACEVLDWVTLSDLPRPAHLGPELLAPVTRALVKARVPMRQSRTQRAA